jgi:hypothetical protein
MLIHEPLSLRFLSVLLDVVIVEIPAKQEFGYFTLRPMRQRLTCW